jgi:hypothetical protein
LHFTDACDPINTTGMSHLQGITPYILSLCVDAGQLYVSVPVFLSNNPEIPWRGGRVGTRVCLDAVEKIKTLI